MNPLRLLALIFLCPFISAEDPFKNNAKIKINNGNVVFESAFDKSITFRTQNEGSVFINEKKIQEMTGLKTSAQNETRETIGRLNFVTQKILQLEQQLEDTSDIATRIDTLEESVASLTSKLDQFIGRGNDRLDPDVIRRIIHIVSDLNEDFNEIKQKLTTNACSSNPCKNGGTCIQNGVNFGFQCLCQNGWYGLMCDEDVNECELFNGSDLGCQNGAECTNIAGSYRCECKADWKGIHCTEKHDDCEGASNEELCDHGTCVNVARLVAGQSNYRCVCDQGWKTDGVNPACRVDVDECLQSNPPCSVNPAVECFNFPGSFSCGNCPSGFTGNGIVCSDINECVKDNGGCSEFPRVQCINTYGSRICGPCPPGFIGDGVTCSFSGLCTQNNGGCDPHAKCIDSSGDVLCECPTGYAGTGFGPGGCVADPNSVCSNNPCIHGTCLSNSATNGFTCRCFDGWSGADCTVRVNDCSSNPCKNGATCVNQVNNNGFVCICDVRWQGSTCEEIRESCGATFEQPFGFIKYPLTDTFELQKEIDCVWIIKTTVGKVIELNFKNFTIEPSVGCSNGFLQINDGEDRYSPKIGKFCGEQLPNSGSVTTTYNQVYIWYQNKISDNTNKFEVSWNTTEPVCGDVFENSFGAIQYPVNGGNYPPNRDCYWLIRVEPSQRIQIHFSYIAIENNTDCDKDYLKFYDEDFFDLLTSFCSSTAQLPPLTSPGPEVIIYFHSDSVSSDRGFHLTFSAIPGIDGCGGTLTAESGSFRIPSPQQFDDEIICDWLIQIHADDKILLTFSEFDLDEYASCWFESIEVFDGNDVDAPLIGRFCGSRLPPKIISSRNTLLVEYRTDDLTSDKNFIANYETYCGGYFTFNTGSFQSPYYPNNYPSNKKCVYHLQVEAGNIIQLQFTDFDVEDLWNGCSNDYVEIREGHQQNGTLVAKLCGHQPPQVITSTVNEIWITFVTDGTLHYRGFAANYSTLNVGCGGVMTNNTGIITPPSHVQMPLNASCNWLIVAPTGFIIQLSFELFSITSHGGNCDYESVEVKEFDRTLIGRYCGRLNLHPIQSRSNVLSVSYNRTIFAPSEGFAIDYVFRDISSVCGGFITQETGFIRSPNFPNSYYQKSNCTWIIRAENGHQIALEVKMFDLNDETCSMEFLEIRNGEFSDSPLIGKFCGTKIERFISSHSNTISLHFQSESTITGKGFEIYYESLLRGCGGTVTQQSGFIMSPNYPLAYNHDAVCNWIIYVAKGSQVDVKLLDVDFEVVQNNCSSDYLEFYDGNSDNSPLLKKVCRMESNPFVTSSSNVMFIKFQTDSRISFRGFQLHYTTKCFNQVTGYRGVIESPNYPNFPVGSINCTWVVEVPIGNNITFTFSYQNITAHDDCSQINATNKKTEEEIPEYTFDICTTNEKIVPTSFNVSSNVAIIDFFRNTISSMFRLEWYAVGCGGEFVGKKSGSFTSPNYPHGYSSKVECLWHITIPVQNYVVLHFTDFSLEMQPDVTSCTTDSVSVYGGPTLNSPLLTTLCHKLAKPLTVSSSGNQMTVRFRSDLSVTGRGFSAYFESKRGQCGGEFENIQGSITSKNYPGKYDAIDDCNWFITVRGFNSVELTFEDFDVPGDLNCSSSFVAVYDVSDESETQLLNHCGQTLPKVIRSRSNSILVRLKADGINSGKGFKANYKAICGGTYSILADDEASHELVSENYPYESIDVQFCSWTIKAEDPSEKIIFSFTNLRSIGSVVCSENYVEVREGDSIEGPLIGRYCGTQIPPTIVSEGNSLFIYLHENAVFRATFTTAISNCGGQLTSESGYFTSPGYPDNYPLNVECIWTIEASPGNRVSLSFTAFHIENNEYCNTDYVEIREVDQAGKFIGRFCGNHIPILNETSANALWVMFRTDAYGSSQGFSAIFSLLHGVDINGTNGIITSPRYPESTTSNDGEYTWTITSPENTFIFLTFLEIEIVDSELSTHCYHYVEISNGFKDDSLPISKYCGFNPPAPIVSTSNVVTIRYSSAYPGKFKLEWLANTTSTTYNNTSNVNSQNNPCVKNIFVDKKSSYELKSPGYPLNYDVNLNCSWTFRTEAGYRFYVDVVEMDTEGTDNCHFDKVNMYEPMEARSLEWKLNQTVCGRDTPQLHSSTNRLRIDFLSDATLSKKGFRILVKTVCGGFFYESFGEISTENVYNSSECEWVFSARMGRTIAVKFLELNIHSESESCTSAAIILRNGQSEVSPFLGAGTYCGTTYPTPLETSSNHLFIKFFAPLNLLAKFRLQFSEVSQTCGGNFELSEHRKSLEIMSPNYPHAPPYDFECDFIISSPPNTEIRVDFDVISVTEICNITQEYIELRDGGSINSRLIRRVCVPVRENSFFSSENIIFIRFVTSGKSVAYTFKASVHINVCGGTHHVFYSETIQSPNYPNSYPDRLDCEWRVYSLASTFVLSITVEDIDLISQSSDCSSGDFIMVEEPNEEVLSRWCKREDLDQVIVTKGSAVIIRFKSDQMDSGRGFALNVVNEYNDCGLVVDPAISGEISTPDFPNAYLHERTCRWVLVAPFNRRIKLTFQNYNLKANERISGECFDELRIIKSPVAGENELGIKMNCSNVLPSPVESLTMGMIVSFSTIGLNANEGFKASYTTDDESLCGGELTDISGVIISYGFPGTTLMFNQSVHCLWIITGENRLPITTASVLFEVFEIFGEFVDENGEKKCGTDVLVLGDGQGSNVAYSDDVFCGNKTGQDFFFIFNNDEYENFIYLAMNYTSNYRGIKARYEIQQCGGYFETEQMNLTSPGFPYGYPPNSLCQWQFVSKYGTKVKLSFGEFVLENDCRKDYILVKNGVYRDSPVIGTFCGNYTPSSMFSSDAQLSLIFRTDSVGTAIGFNFSVEMLSKSCGGYFSDYSKIISSPNYPAQYSNNIECEWEIDVESSYHLIISFIDRFDIEKSTDCKHDYVLIEENIYGLWIKLTKLCGQVTPEPIKTLSHSVRITFRTNSKINGDGFKLSYNVGCGAVFTANRGVITSPNYPGKYAPSINCDFLIQLDSNDLIKLHFEDFDVENNKKCNFDSLTVYNGNNTASTAFGPYCGKGIDKIPSVFVNRGSLLINFNTDYSVQKRGFKARYLSLPCGGHLTEDNGEIESPSDATHYLNNLDCLWNITVSENRVVQLKFESMDVENCFNCSCDSVSVIDGGHVTSPEIGKFCSSFTPPSIKSSSNNLLIVFKSDNSFVNTGFRVVYRSTLGEKQGCGGILENETGVILSPDNDGDGLYDLDLDCIWTIIAPENAVIELNFESMNIERNESSSSCPYDYLEIRDGITHMDTLIEKLCGNQFPGKIRSSESKLFIHFHSDGKTNKAGFRLTYNFLNSSCGGSFEVTNIIQTITSPNFPNLYPAVSRCRYHFTIENSWRDRISFKFTSFNLSCEDGDFIEFADENNQDFPYRMCGNKDGAKLVGVNKIWMTFVSGTLVKGNRKFSVDVSLLSCNDTYDADSGFITNRNYPLTSWSENCVIHIKTPNNSKISLYFYEIEIDWDEESSDCSTQKIDVIVNSTDTLATLCAGALPNPIFTSTNQVFLKLYPSAAYKYYILYSSTTLDEGCGGNITSINGLFTSPLFPAAYKKNAVCVWNIRSLGMHSVTLSFTEFDFNSTVGCSSNFIEVFDGIELSEENKVIRYCGEDTPGEHTFDGNTFTIRMVTDTNNDGVGFRAKFIRSQSGFTATHKIMTLSSKPEIREGSVHLSGL